MRSPPPKFLIPLLDGTSEAALLVRSNGVIWHANEPARRLFNIVDGKGISVSTYLSFSTTRFPGRETLRLSWTDVTSPDSFVESKQSVDGVGTCANGNRFPVTISLVRIQDSDGTDSEVTNSGEQTSSDRSDGNEHIDDSCFFCFYVQDLTPARLQLASLEEEINRLSAVKDAVIDASGQSLIVADQRGCIQSVGRGVSEIFGYERDDGILNRSVGALMQEMGGNFDLSDHRRREVEGHHCNGDTIELEVGLADIRSDRGHKAIMIRDVTQQKESQRQEALNDRISRGLRERSYILDAAFDPLFCTNQTGIIFMVNQAAVNEFGWSRGEFIGQNVSMIVGGCHRNRHDSYMQRYMQTGEKRMIGKRREIQARRKDGTEFVAELGLAEITHPGEDIIFCGFIRNLSRQKVYERKLSAKVIEVQEISQELKENESIMRGILDASFDALFVINTECTIRMVNKKSIEVFGWTSEELMGQNINIIMPGNVGAKHDKYVREYLKTGIKKMIGTQREITAQRKDGSTFPCVLGLAETQKSGLICGFVRDLTTEKEQMAQIIETQRAEKRASIELLQNQSIVLGILDASFHAMFVIDKNCNILMVNKMSCSVFGWSKEDFIGKNINIIMPADVASKHDQYIKQYLETGIKKMIGTQREVTAQRRDGSTFPCVLGLAETQTSDLYCGFIRDLTSEKAAQEQLLENHKLTTQIIEASFDALFVINEQGIIQMVNSSSTRVFGWTREEFLGENMKMIMPAIHAKNHDTYLHRYLQTGFRRMIGKERELEARRKDGSTFPCILGLTEVEGSKSKQFVGFIRDVTIQKSLLLAEAEREASDTLLFNILPEHIAKRLKQDPSHIADHYDNTTILFADIVGFTDKTSVMPPHEVVTLLNDIFSRFDFLVGVYELNKVKTIGDCYMVTSIPSSEMEHDGCARVCRFAIDLMKAVQSFNCSGQHSGQKKQLIEFRVGIATGQVVAGVVGTKRFLFDMWGDAVNVAARMEQNGLAGQIQVTKEVVDNAGSDFNFELRGTLAIKGKGPMDVYILKSAKDSSHRHSANEHHSSRGIPSAVRSVSTLF